MFFILGPIGRLSDSSGKAGELVHLQQLLPGVCAWIHAQEPRVLVRLSAFRYQLVLRFDKLGWLPSYSKRIVRDNRV